MPLNKLRDFEKKLNTPIGGVKYTALKNGLYNYYSTLNGIGGNLALTFYSLPGEETEYDNDNYRFEGYQDKFINAVISFHHFIELHIKGILYQCHPLLATDMRKMDNSRVLEYLEKEKIEPEDRSIDFAIALELLKSLKQRRTSGDKKYKLDSRHDFLLNSNHLQTIRKLLYYRNSTLHKADIILPYIPFDYFISQHVFPLVNQILANEQKYSLNDVRNETDCGINVFKEILSIKFELKELKKDASVSFINKIERLAHLKELGRASFSLPVSLPIKALKKEIRSIKNGKNISNKNDLYWMKCQLKQFELAEELAQIESKKTNTQNIYKCPCCGGNTLLAYWRIDTPLPGIPKAYKEVTKASCNFCSYSINPSMGDPYNSKITKEQIFDCEDDDIGWPFKSCEPDEEEKDSYREVHGKFKLKGKVKKRSTN